MTQDLLQKLMTRIKSLPGKQVRSISFKADVREAIKGFYDIERKEIEKLVPTAIKNLDRIFQELYQFTSIDAAKNSYQVRISEALEELRTAEFTMLASKKASPDGIFLTHKEQQILSTLRAGFPSAAACF